ncbi:MAG TPA: twin-arginine translocase TatA/TatE family subunit [Spongiibacteraceae bacterium]|nr:twin-arginine translocase TatA/TatE family subunit [Spongiibacteraceae bacterium]HCS29497.1 twin-arginine translocase TatA/TatE family subunit [Spongiibacteraceae bacterium]|tara:strand:+ start:1103 stop:1318 length:216 start_codon:yes stop_codon:yes gene_type:complete
MGFGIKELVVILVIVLLLFGTKKLKGIGSDLGGAIKGFKKSMSDDKAENSEETAEPLEPNQINSEHKDKSA